MKVGWVLRLENGDNYLTGVLRSSKQAAEECCKSLSEKTKAEIISMYTEYDSHTREIREFAGNDVKQLLKELVDQNPLLISSKDGKISIEVDKVT